MAPVIIFAFNRLDALINVITSLLLNEEAQESDLFVFVDGAREGKVGERELVCSVCRYIENIVGFKSVNYTFYGVGLRVVRPDIILVSHRCKVHPPAPFSVK